MRPGLKHRESWHIGVMTGDHHPSHHPHVRGGKAHVYLSAVWSIPDASLERDSGPVLPHTMTPAPRRPIQSDSRDSEPISTHGREPLTVTMWTVALRQLAYCAALCPMLIDVPPPRFSSSYYYDQFHHHASNQLAPND